MSKKENEVLQDKNYVSELVYDGFHKIKKITRKSKEKEFFGEVLEKGDTVACLIFNTESNKYIFIESYKLAANGTTIESVQGNVEEGEKPKQSVKRLVTEITGYKVDESKILNSYFTDTNNSDEICSLFYVEVSEKIIKSLDFKDYGLVEIERLGLGGKLFPNNPEDLTKIDVKKDEKILPPYQVLDMKTLIAVMWIENNNVLKEVAQLITNFKIRSL